MDTVDKNLRHGGAAMRPINHFRPARAAHGNFIIYRICPLGHQQGQRPAVQGFALGTASHGIGAARAMQEHADAGAYAGLALGLQVLLSALLMPLVARWF